MPLRVACAGPAWRTRQATGLVTLEAETQGAELAWDFRWPAATTTVQSVDLRLGQREPGRRLLLAVSADDGPEKIFAVPGASSEVVRIRADSPFATLRLRLVAGQAVLAGLEPLYAQGASALVDLYAVPGATMEGWLGASEEVPARRRYDLAVLAFGTNEAAVPAFSPNAYADSLRRSLGGWRKFFPDSRCVLVAPPDRGDGAAGRAPSRRHHQVAVVQRVVGRSFGCESWDWQGWMRSSAGAPLHADATHLSARGYEASGRAFATAIALGGR
jgi:lysophospholipase L1-like esterase